MGTSLLHGVVSRFLTGALLLLLAATPLAQERPLFPGQNQNRPAAADANTTAGSDALSLLLDQLNELRTETQALRALVEEQQFEIRRLQRDSLNRYTNIDERLQSLESGAASAATVPDAGASARVTPPPTTTPQGLPSATESSPPSNAASARPEAPPPAAVSPARGRASTLQPAVISEQQLYQMAYESAINENFERSIAEFDQYLSVYPAGRFVANAHYWKGQSYRYLNRFDEARSSYEIILNEYADSPKLPDAMYGLGQAFQELGDTSRARELYNNIKRSYPNTGVANLADSSLQSLD